MGRVLICTYGTPRFDQDSGSRRVLDHVEFLREEGWSVDFYAVNGLSSGRYTRALERRGVGLYAESILPLGELLQLARYDVVLFAFWQTAERFVPLVRRVLPEANVIVDSVDLQFLRDARRVFGGASRSASPVLGEDYASELIGELNCYRAADAIFTVSDKEAEFVNDLLASEGLAVPVPDAEQSDSANVPYRERHGIVFVGSFYHPPNRDAVEYLCGDVLHRMDESLLEQHPVCIVGAGVDDRLNVPRHVSLVGWVPSIQPYLERARVSVVPLRYGAGTKRKLLQALMVGTPTVSTTIGAEGLPVVDRRHLLIADDADAFAEAVTNLLRDETLWKRIAGVGRAEIEAIHGREAVRRRFLDALEAARSRPSKPALLREQDFSTYLVRLRYQEHQKIEPAIRELVASHTSARSVVVVASEGSSEFLGLHEREVWPFPRAADGSYAGSPTSDDQAVRHLEELRSLGADYLLIPHTARWDFFGRYPGLLQHLKSRYRALVSNEDVCFLYALSDNASAGGNGYRVEVPEAGNLSAGTEEGIRPIAFYLPQYHPIPENDLWWGRGFTEWTNVAKARPLFADHYQPHLPADLGFYDLRSPETRAAQAELAATYGISGFCYYHYWFSGKQLLERPFQEVLESREPDFPFCLCWANEPWSGRWHGRNEDVLQPQRYSYEDDVAHIRWLLPALADPRAIKIDEKPIMIIYQARDLPDPARTIELWQKEAHRAGLGDLFLLTVETGWDEGWDATSVGFDAKIMFRPQFSILRQVRRSLIPEAPSLEVYDYADAWTAFAERTDVAYRHYETVCPGWDNSARVGDRAVVLHGSTPDAYAQWLNQVVERAMTRSRGERIFFINAWNEWAEGCHLEPDQRWGRAYLEATREAVFAVSRPRKAAGRLDGSSSQRERLVHATMPRRGVPAR